MDNTKLKSFKDLLVWQKAIDLAALVYLMTEKFPKSELYGIVNQMRRSVVSISSNIAEGFKRNHGKEKLQFYNIAYGSIAELESQIEVSYKLNFFNLDDYQKLNTTITEIGKMIDGLIKSQNKKFPKSYILNSIFFFIVLYSIFHLLNPLSVDAARLELNSQVSEIAAGQQFQIDLLLDTEGESTNALEGKVIFPGDAVELKEVRDGSSIINLWVEKPSLNSKSYIPYSGITPGGFNGKNGLIFSAIFEATKDGVIRFGIEDARVLRNDGTGSAAELRVENLEFRILDLGRKEVLYPKSYILYPDDKERPESFRPEIARDEALFGGRWFLVFAAQDKGSGIDHYEVYEDLGFRIQDLGKVIKKVLYSKFYILNSWTITESPYVLTDQNLRSHIYIKAVDKRGNERIAVVEPRYPLNWYENWWIWSIIILGIVMILTARRIMRKFLSSKS